MDQEFLYRIFSLNSTGTIFTYFIIAKNKKDATQKSQDNHHIIGANMISSVVTLRDTPVIDF